MLVDMVMKVEVVWLMVYFVVVCVECGELDLGFILVVLKCFVFDVVMEVIIDVV